MMGDNTSIEWTDATWNPIRARNRRTGKVGWFCVHASPGCANCYAEGINRRRGSGVDFKAQLQDEVELFLDENILSQPLRWKRPRRIFVGSMTDLYGDFVPDKMLYRIWAVMALARQHTFQVLTKRAERQRSFTQGMFADGLERWGLARVPHPTGDRALFDLLDVDYFLTHLPNVWAGISAEDQARYDERWAELSQTPAAIRFISAEPLLGPIEMRLARGGVRPDQVIVGGESGPRARPMHPAWARQIRDECAGAGVAFLFKQWGEWTPGENVERQTGSVQVATWFDDGWLIQRENLAAADGHVDDEPDLYRVGKRAGGRRLDGEIHDGFPNPAGRSGAPASPILPGVRGAPGADPSLPPSRGEQTP